MAATGQVIIVFQSHIHKQVVGPVRVRTARSPGVPLSFYQREKENNVSQALQADSLLGPAGQNRVTGHRLSWEMDKVERVVDSS